MQEASVLAALALRLNREAGARRIPSLYFVTDPARTPDPVRSARRLPAGTAVIYRHFGAPDRARVARTLARVCRARGLVLLIAADPALARRVGADGVHWPERRRRRAGEGLVTAAIHSLRAAAKTSDVDAILLAPVFTTRSASGRAPLGLMKAARIARASKVPVIALGGVNANNARRLTGRGFAGLACVDALSGF